MKRLPIILLFGLLFFSACRKTTPPPSETTASSEITSSSQIEPSTEQTTSSEVQQSSESHSEEPIPVKTQRNLVGTWEQSKQTLTVDTDGNWQLTGKINSSGQLTVAADFNHTQMVQLYGFNQNLDGLGTYFIANFNDDSTRMGFGYLGQFTRVGDVPTTTLSPNIFQHKYLTTPVDFNTNILGTWTIKTGTEFHNTWNYNPDGTFELYSDGRGQSTTGDYTVKALKGNWIDVTYVFDDGSEGYTNSYLLENGVMTENNFEDIKIVRNLVPDFPQ